MKALLDPRMFQYFLDYTIWSIPKSLGQDAWMLGLYLATVLLYCFIPRIRRIGRSHLMRVLLAETVVYIVMQTIVLRPIGDEYSYNLMPFWSYQICGERGLNLLVENFLNVVLYLPVGFFLAGAGKDISFKRVVLGGCLLSVFTEVCQLLLKRGHCETDDVIHNTLGAVIGYLIYRLAAWVYGKIKRRKLMN